MDAAGLEPLHGEHGLVYRRVECERKTLPILERRIEDGRPSGAIERDLHRDRLAASDLQIAVGNRF